MTYNGQYVVNTNSKSLIGAPGQTSYYSMTATGLSAANSGTKRHFSYQAGDYLYVLQGNTTGSGGYNIFRAPKTDPTNIIKTGSVALYKGSTTHTNSGTPLIVGDYIYMYGNSSEPTAIFKAPISSPESWQTVTDVLPFSVGGQGVPMTIIGSTIYAFGDGSNSTADKNKIFTASTSAPTVFTYSGSDTPSGRTGTGLAVTPTKIYLYGGNIGGIEDGKIYSANIGAPLTWVDTGSTLPINYNYCPVFVSDNYIYIIGGRSAGLISTVYRSPIADGITFTSVYTLAAATNMQTMERINGRLYITGGESATLQYEVSVADLDNNVASPFITVSRVLPNGRCNYASIGIDDTYYIYGGNNVASGLPTGGVVQSCAIHKATATTRSPANFSTTTTALPVAFETSGWYCSRIDDTIWLFGGVTAVGSLSNRVWSAPVATPTVLTQASTTGPLSSHGKHFIYNGYIYVVGGDNYNSTTNSSVYKAPITNPSSWVAIANTLPSGLTRYSLAVIENYVYLFGGATTISSALPGTSVSTVYRSLLSELDTVGNANWISVTALATVSADHVMVISNNYLYLIGGTSGSFTSIGTIQSCLISELAGGISNFKNLGNFTPSATNIAGANAVYHDGDFYILGGRTSTTAAAVTTIHRTSNRALLKTFGDVKESSEAVPAISLGSGNANSYNYFMQSGNFPWIVAKTT